MQNWICGGNGREFLDPFVVAGWDLCVVGNGMGVWRDDPASIHSGDFIFAAVCGCGEEKFNS